MEERLRVITGRAEQRRKYPSHWSSKKRNIALPTPGLRGARVGFNLVLLVVVGVAASETYPPTTFHIAISTECYVDEH